MANNPVYHKHSKHAEVNYHFIKEKEERKDKVNT